MDGLNLLMFLQVLFVHVFRYTALGLSIPLKYSNKH
nr:MAG TPA: ATP synthase E chain [Bacteriophage sp.]